MSCFEFHNARSAPEKAKKYQFNLKNITLHHFWSPIAALHHILSIDTFHKTPFYFKNVPDCISDVPGL
jgi:hypothetical protein